MAVGLIVAALAAGVLCGSLDHVSPRRRHADQGRPHRRLAVNGPATSVVTAKRPRVSGHFVSRAEAIRRGWWQRAGGTWGWCPLLFGPEDVDERPANRRPVGVAR